MWILNEMEILGCHKFLSTHTLPKKMFLNIFCSQNCLIMIVAEQVKICQKKEKKIFQPHLEFIFYFYSSNFEDFFSFLIFLKTLLQNFSSSLSLTFLLCITQHQNLFIQLDLISKCTSGK